MTTFTTEDRIAMQKTINPYKLAESIQEAFPVAANLLCEQADKIAELEERIHVQGIANKVLFQQLEAKEGK